MARTLLPAPVRWLLALAVRLFRAPAVRRRLLPLLFPGRTVAESGRVYRDRWQVEPPALGARCVPSCTDPAIDWDGTHYCRVRIGRVGLPEMYRWAGEVHGVGVEVTQTQGEPRKVWLTTLDRDGAFHGHAILMTPATSSSVAALLDTAFVIAGQADRLPTGGAR